ncbi:hypothetical protein HPB47_025924 [Ixodes persulcatus]|uniref:Uncharacterized protein n=1 Tax=Ixodes persulcatus TaxID=34615 RepID=A0AC60Q055_IXOPE|nr:hypothetical protein HPB47_025924 [Ixodes persulcatus]
MLKLGDTFDSFADWKAALDEFCRATDQGFKVHTSKSVMSYNKKLQASRLKSKTKVSPTDELDEKWQFAHVQYVCVLSRGKSRPRDDANGKLVYKKCQAGIGIKYTKQLDKLLIIKINLEHNHSDTPDAPPDAPPDGGGDLSQDAAVQDATMQDAAMQDATMQDAAMQDATMQDAAMQDAAVQDATTQDPDGELANDADSSTTSDSEEDDDPVGAGVGEEYRALSVRLARALPLSLGREADAGEVAALLAELEKLEASDADAAVSIVVNQGNVVTAVLFQTGPMRRSFRQFPELLLLDTGYAFAMAGGFSLVSLSGHDASGLGCPFAFAVLTRPIRMVLGLLLSVFASANPCASQVRVLLLGKEQLRLRGLGHYFEKADTTLLCHYHVIRSLLSKMEQLKLSGAEQERLCRTLRAMLACLHERSYSDNLKRLEQMDARFGRHFRRAWHERRDLWAGFRRGGIVPWCLGVNDRIEALVQFLQAVCSQSRSLCEAVCNLAYGAHGVLARTSTDAMLDEIREYNVHLLQHEARLLAACCDYAALHVLVQLRISRSHKFSAVQTDQCYVVNSAAGRGVVGPGSFACTCAFRQTYGLPCVHAFVLAHARGTTIPLEAVDQRWRRCGPFPVDLCRAASGPDGGGAEGAQAEHRERLSRVRDLVDSLTSLVVTSPPDDFAHMAALLGELYRTWAQDTRLQVSLCPKVKEELLDLDLSHKDVASGLEGSHAVLSDDDADMVRDGMDVFAGSEKREEPPAPLVKLPDEAVFGFSGGMFKEEGARGGEEVYGLHSGDLSCFTTSIGTNAGPGPGDGRHLGDLFGYGSAADFPRGRDSPVLLSIKDDELGDSSKEVARIKWDNEESYKLLDSIMEAEGSEKLDCVADDMMAAGSGQRLQADVEGSLLQDSKDAGEPAQ